jgi:hypothetical protein
MAKSLLNQPLVLSSGAAKNGFWYEHDDKDNTTTQALDPTKNKGKSKLPKCFVFI